VSGHFPDLPDLPDDLEGLHGDETPARTLVRLRASGCEFIRDFRIRRRGNRPRHETETSAMGQLKERKEMDDKGIHCRKCGSDQFWVVYTRADRGAQLVRRRECRGCKARITTWEREIGNG
jgi:hypothetical protein